MTTIKMNATRINDCRKISKISMEKKTKKLKRKTSNNEHENKKMTYRNCTDVNSLT